MAGSRLCVCRMGLKESQQFSNAALASRTTKRTDYNHGSMILEHKENSAESLDASERKDGVESCEKL